MIETLKNAFANKDIRKKILLTLLLLVVFRIGCYIPVPGLARGLLTDAVTTNDFLGLMSGVTGGALANGTLFALGIGPYINASIIVQLLTVGIPALERLSKQGEEGRKKITNITRIITIVLAVIQAVGIIVNFAGGFQDMASSDSIRWDLFFNQQWLGIVYMTVIYTAGAMLVMWLGERITEYGVGNGISLIIFVGIISTAGLSILDKLTSITANNVAPLFEVIGFLVLAVVVFFCIVFVDLAERKIPVQYAKQVRGTKMYGGPLDDHERRPRMVGCAQLVEPGVRLGNVDLRPRAHRAHLRVRILLRADPVQPRRRQPHHPAERRLHPGHPPRQAHGAVPA